MSSINLLEKNLQKILRSAGFDPEHRVDLNGYEIDVYVEYKSTQIVFECKQYQRGNLTVRNLIHQWSGKQEELEVDRVVLVLVGVTVNEEAYKLAEQRGIKIWQGEKVDKLLEEVIDGASDLKKNILHDLNLHTEDEIIEEVSKKYYVGEEASRKYMEGDIDKSKLEQMRKNKASEVIKEVESVFDDENGILKYADKERLRNGDYYYGKLFKDVVEKMVELGIQDKKIARLFVGDKGGTAYKETYSKRKINKIEYTIKEFGYSFDKAKSLIFEVEPEMKALRRASKVRSERSDLEIREIYDCLKRGFDVREIKKREVEGESHGEQKNKTLYEISKEMDEVFEEGIDVMSRRDKKRYKNNEKYYNITFRNIVEKMIELRIKDKKVARLFVGDTGGTADGEKYSKRDIKKIELLMKEFDYSFETMKKFVFLEAPKMRMLRRAVNVHTERKDLQFDEIYKCLEEGFTVREIKRGGTKREKTEQEKNATDTPENEEKQSSSEDSSSDTDEDEKDGDEEEIPAINSSGELVTSDEEGHPPVTPSNEKAELNETETATAVVAVGLILLVVLLLVFG